MKCFIAKYLNFGYPLLWCFKLISFKYFILILCNTFFPNKEQTHMVNINPIYFPSPITDRHKMWSFISTGKQDIGWVYWSLCEPTYQKGCVYLCLLFCGFMELPQLSLWRVNPKIKPTKHHTRNKVSLLVSTIG